MLLADMLTGQTRSSLQLGPFVLEPMVSSANDVSLSMHEYPGDRDLCNDLNSGVCRRHFATLHAGFWQVSLSASEGCSANSLGP